MVPVPVLHVVAGVLIDAAGRVLLAQRPAGKELAGFWEFPGGKLEPGESPEAALRRELHEELAIHADDIEPQPLLSVPIPRTDRTLLLAAHRVLHWQGQPRSCEGQAWCWRALGEAEAMHLAPADRRILDALARR